MTKKSKAAMVVLNKIINGIIFVLIGLGAAFLLLFVLGIRPYVVLSPSMEPAIGVGSVVFVNQNTKMSELQVGDVISFRKSDIMATHRVHEIQGDQIITKGDMNEEIDGGYVTAETLIGKNVFTLPKVGYVVQFMQSTFGMIISGAVLLALIIASLATGQEEEGKKKKRAKEAPEDDEDDDSDDADEDAHD